MGSDRVGALLSNSWWRCAGSALWCGLLLLSASVAVADKGPSDIDKDAARTLVQQGDEHAKQHDYAAALEAYRRADDIMGVPTTSIEVGRTAEKLDKLVEALHAYRKAAAHPPRRGEPRPFSRARVQAAKLAKQVRARIPVLHLEIAGPGPDTDIAVSIDEEPIDAWARALDLDPGAHAIVARAAGYRDGSQTVVLEEGAERTVSITLERLPATAVPDGAAPVAEQPTELWPLVYAGYGVAVAGGIVGAITGVMSLNDAAEAKQYCNGEVCAPAASDPLDSSRALGHASTASFVIAGVGAVVGTVGLVITLSVAPDAEASGPDEEEAGEAALVVGPGSVWVRVGF